MDFTNQEISQIKKDEIFSKTINDIKYWIKPLKEYSNYKEASIKSHKKYFQILTKYISEHIPETIFFNQNITTTLLIQKHIKGRKPKTLKEFKKILNEKQNNNLRYGIQRLLKEKEIVLDFFIFKDNFIITKNNKIYYIDGRMPLFSNRKEKRYQNSKIKTEKVLN